MKVVKQDQEEVKEETIVESDVVEVQEPKNPMKEQMKIWETQINSWKERVKFLKGWIKALEGESEKDMMPLECFETKNKIWELQIEIDAKENVIDKRHRDMEKSKVMLEKNMDELKKNWKKCITDIQNMRDNDQGLPTEHRVLVNGIINRAKRNEYKNGQQQFNDMQLAQNLLASRNKKG